MYLVNWTNQLAMHQSSVMRAMAKNGWNVTMVVAESLSADRSATGWSVPDYSNTDIILNPDTARINALIRRHKSETVHVFGGALEYSWGREAVLRAAQSDCQMGLMSEAADPYGWKGPFRRAKHTLNRLAFGRNFHFVLAMGAYGIQWFKRCGYSPNKLYPFGYFVEQYEPENETTSNAEACSLQSFELLYVGRLVELKRIDLLLHSIQSLTNYDFRLTVIGDGPKRPSLERLSTKLGLRDHVRWLGTLPQEQVRKHMSSASLLVLPSRYDGWGAVVNEALMAGTPVICTRHCGAADLLAESWRGEVVPANNLEAMTAAIRHRLHCGPLPSCVRHRIRDWAACITGDQAAGYLQAILGHVFWGGERRPSAPWNTESKYPVQRS